MVTSIMIWPDWLGRSISCLIYRQDLREVERTEKEKKIYSVSTQKVFQPHFSVVLMHIWQNIYVSIVITPDVYYRTCCMFQEHYPLSYMHNYCDWVLVSFNTVPECLLCRHAVIIPSHVRICHICNIDDIVTWWCVCICADVQTQQ